MNGLQTPNIQEFPMFILAAPLAYLVVSLMAVGIGHDLSSAQTQARSQPSVPVKAAF
jgi:hypothetical protein